MKHLKLNPYDENYFIRVDPNDFLLTQIIDSYLCCNGLGRREIFAAAERISSTDEFKEEVNK